MMQVCISQGKYAIVSSKDFTLVFETVEDVAWYVITDLLEEQVCTYTLHSLYSDITLDQLHKVLKKYISNTSIGSCGISVNRRCHILSGYSLSEDKIVLEKYLT